MEKRPGSSCNTQSHVVTQLWGTDDIELLIIFTTETRRARSDIMDSQRFQCLQCLTVSTTETIEYTEGVCLHSVCSVAP